MNKLSPIFYCLLGALLLCLANSASAISIELLEDMQKSFKTETEKWFDPLINIAQQLLLGLAILSLAWNFLQVVIRNGDFQEIVMVLVKHLLTVGLFLALIINAQDWSNALLSSYETAAGMVSGKDDPDMSAASVMRRGIVLGQKITEDSSAWWESMVRYPLSMVLVALYGVVAAYVMLVYAEIYIITVGGIILLGFAGTDWTLDYARRYLTYCVSAGAKLYTLYLVVGIGTEMLNTWVDQQDLELMSVVVSIVGVTLVMTILVIMAPNMVQSMINGAAISGAIGQTGTSAKAAVAGATMLATGGVGGMPGGGGGGIASGIKAATSRLAGSSGKSGHKPPAAGGNTGSQEGQARRFSLLSDNGSSVASSIQPRSPGVRTDVRVDARTDARADHG